MAQAFAVSTRRAGMDWRGIARRASQSYSFGFAALLTVLLLVVNLLTENGGFGLTSQLANVAPFAIAAIASAPSIIAGGFDLSISPLIIFTNSLYVVWLAPNGLAGAVSVPIVLAVGCAIGAATGLLIVLLRVQPIVVTLAMYFALQGVDLLLAPNPVTIGNSGWVGHLAGSFGGLPGGVLTMGIPLLVWACLRLVPLRRLLYAVGSNETTAYSSGVNVDAIHVASYALGGLFAGFGGFAVTALVSSANASTATEYTLVSIAALVLGGTSLAGGRGGLLGAFLGAVAIYLLQNLLATFQINPAYLQIVYGGILVVAVVLGGALVPSPGGKRPAALWSRSRSLRQLRAASWNPMAAQADGPPQHRDPIAAGERGTPWRRAVAVQTRFPMVQLVGLVAIFAYGAISLPGLGSWTSMRSIILLAALVGLASGGQTLLILMGGFDLSVSGFIVAGALMVTQIAALYGIPFGAALVLALVGSALLGGSAGYVCHRFRVNPLIVTLATGTIAVGLLEIQTGGIADGTAPQWLTTLAEPATRTFGLAVPPTILIWIVVAALFALFLQRTPAGRKIFATGANARAADYALVNTRRVWVATFAFSASASALVGVLIGGFAGTIDSTLGDPYLFQSVVAVVVGGTVFGGPGDYTRTCIGALFLTVLTTVLVGHGVTAASEQIIYGVIILAAIAVYGRQRRLRDRL